MSASPRVPESDALDDYLVLGLRMTELNPFVWRKLLIPASLPVEAFNRVVQDAMGWRDCHPARLEVPPAEGMDRQSIRFDGGSKPKRLNVGRTVGDVMILRGQTLTYLYDLQKPWAHEVKVEKLVRLPEGIPIRCLAGGRACPP